MSKYTIVHIENNNFYLEMIKRVFNNINIVKYFPLYVHSQKDAYELIDKFSPIPDLIITDLMLNDDVDPQPGVDLIIKIQNNPKFVFTKIMALTATVQEYPKNKLSKGGVYYYSKTFRPIEWIEEVKFILAKDGSPNA